MQEKSLISKIMEKGPSIEKKEAPYTIRSAEPRDVMGILTVRKETWINTYPNQELGITTQDLESINFFDESSIASWQDLTSNPDPKRKVLVAESEEKVVGYLFLKQGKMQNKILGYYVLPSYQGKGIGTQMMQQGLKWLDPNKETYLEVAPYSEAAIKQYERFGFEKSGEEKTTATPVPLPNGKTLPSISMIRPKQNP